ncbi:MAG TPA: NAD(P)H-binding protein [Streptosporangiaceae bacterium]|nr:NAD(P)H-binding protein [Streptosporangiaceae bacterium]
MTILATGARGNVGRLVAGQLAGSGAHVRALTRNPAAARFPGGVEAAEGDLARPETPLPPRRHAGRRASSDWCRHSDTMIMRPLAAGVDGRW